MGGGGNSFGTAEHFSFSRAIRKEAVGYQTDGEMIAIVAEVQDMWHHATSPNPHLL